MGSSGGKVATGAVLRLGAKCLDSRYSVGFFIHTTGYTRSGAFAKTSTGKGITGSMNGETTAERTAEKREKLAFYRGEISREWTLLTARVGTLITSQSFLVTAYTISLGNANAHWGERFTLIYPLLLAIVGLTVAFYSYPAITGAARVIELWHKKQGRLFLLDPDATEANPDAAKPDPEMADYRDDRPLTVSKATGKVPMDAIQAQSLRYCIVTPLVFGVTWIVLVALVLTLHFVR